MVDAHCAPHHAILTAAAQLHADIIVMGAHRKNLLKDVFVGTTIERVIRTGSWPVLMVNQEPTAAYGNILFALDLSEASAAAAKIAITLGLLGDARLGLAHAFDPVAESKMIIADVSQEKIEDYVKEEQLKATSELLEFARGLPLDVGRCHVHVVEGDAAAVIANIVRSQQLDLVVAGTHGRSGIGKFF
ncbi:MAG TPA: universal stress protein [Hyphomicrobium sp.]|nr:universal stress protein [Hyphomicrobium sp.]